MNVYMMVERMKRAGNESLEVRRIEAQVDHAAVAKLG